MYSEGDYILHYEIHGHIGSGGMGNVYKARDTKLGRMVALKFLGKQWLSEPSIRMRFIQEAKAASAIDHTNICTIYQIDELEDGALFIAMAYYEGATLRDLISQGQIPPERSKEIIRQICSGLHAAHQKKIVHRDVKPSNIMVTDQDHVKIVDFGFSRILDKTRITLPGQIGGTEDYMSPEQWVGEAGDPRTDIWAVGVIVYEMITGVHPFRGDIAKGVSYRVMNHEPDPIDSHVEDVPQFWQDIVDSSLAKAPQDRLSSMDDLLNYFQDPAIASSDLTFGQAKKHSRIRGSIKVLVVLAVLFSSLYLLTTHVPIREWYAEYMDKSDTNISELYEGYSRADLYFFEDFREVSAKDLDSLGWATGSLEILLDTSGLSIPGWSASGYSDAGHSLDVSVQRELPSDDYQLFVMIESIEQTMAFHRQGLALSSDDDFQLHFTHGHAIDAFGVVQSTVEVVPILNGEYKNLYLHEISPVELNNLVWLELIVTKEETGFTFEFRTNVNPLKTYELCQVSPVHTLSRLSLTSFGNTEASSVATINSTNTASMNVNHIRLVPIIH